MFCETTDNKLTYTRISTYTCATTHDMIIGYIDIEIYCSNCIWYITLYIKIYLIIPFKIR